MRKLIFPKSLLCWFGGWLVLTACCKPACAEDDESTWAQRAWLGPQVGFNIRAKFSLSGQFPISSSQPGPAGVSGVDHFYNDGYVRVDQTGNAQGFTSFWGYNSASQYDAGNHTLLMHSATAYTANAASTHDDEPYVGFQLGYGASPWQWEKVQLGFEFGFGFLPIRIEDKEPLAALVDQSTYSFDTGGIVLPTAPYNGGPSGIGPTIHDVATALSDVTVPSMVTGSRTLAADLFTFRLGPAVHWNLSHYFGLSASAGGALGLVSGDLKFNEQIFLPDGTSASNTGSIGSTEVVYGGFVSAAARVYVAPHAEIYASIEYMPLGNATFGSAGRHAELDLGGQLYVSAGLSWPF